MISVVIPVHNRADIVSRTLGSLAAQTRQPDRIILVDNASTDSTRGVLDEWADGRDNVMVVSEERRGAPAARNRGLREVTTEYVLFFDSDDLMPATHVEEICRGLEAAGHPELGVFDGVIRDLDGRLLHRPYRGARNPIHAHIFHGDLATQRMVISTARVRAAGEWDESLPVWNDYELGVRLLASGCEPCHLTLTHPVEVIRTEESITGTGFSEKAGLWERSLDRCEEVLRGAGLNAEARLIDYRRAILAANYRREGNPEAAEEVMARISGRRALMKFVALYVRAGGRGVGEIARLFH